MTMTIYEIMAGLVCYVQGWDYNLPGRRFDAELIVKQFLDTPLPDGRRWEVK